MPRTRFDLPALAALALLGLLGAREPPVAGEGVAVGPRGRAHAAPVRQREATVAVRGTAVAPPPGTCPGAVYVLDEAGDPLADAVLIDRGGRYLRTDAEGHADWPDRPCGVVGPELRVGDVRYPTATTMVSGGEDLVYTLPEENLARVILLDENCLAWDQPLVRPSSVSAIERVGPGTFDLWSPEAEVSLTVRRDGADAVFRVAMDGGSHLLSVLPGRRVVVEVACAEDNCPPMWCGWDPCVDEGGGRHLCSCAANEPVVRASLHALEWPLPADATRVRVDATRPEAGPLEVVERAPPATPCAADAADTGAED